MATIKEIAAMTGVSPTTVANVIHGRTNKVSKENLERIRAALKENHYVPKLAYETITKGKTKIIGVVIHITKQFQENIAADPFYGQLIGFLEKEIREAGYYTMLYMAENVEEIFRTAASWNMAGIIAVSFTTEDYFKLTSMMDACPVVSIDAIKKDMAQTVPGLYNITLDDFNGGKEITEYLLGQGYERVVFATEFERYTNHPRYRGYRECLKEHGIRFRDRDRVLFDVIDDRKNQESFRYLASLKNSKTAVFCMSDQVALRVMHGLFERGVRIPEELGIAGYDDSIYAKMVWPALTTMHQSVRQKAETAISMLLSLISGQDEIAECEILLPTRLVVRATTKVLEAL